MSAFHAALGGEYVDRWWPKLIMLTSAADRFAALPDGAAHSRECLHDAAASLAALETGWRGLLSPPEVSERLFSWREVRLIEAARSGDAEALERAALAYAEWARTLEGAADE